LNPNFGIRFYYYSSPCSQQYFIYWISFCKSIYYYCYYCYYHWVVVKHVLTYSQGWEVIVLAKIKIMILPAKINTTALELEDLFFLSKVLLKEKDSTSCLVVLGAVGAGVGCVECGVWSVRYLGVAGLRLLAPGVCD
jgi:hypothetical protein